MVASLISPQGLNSRNLRQSSPEGVSKNSFGAWRNTLTYRRTFDRHHTLFSNRASRKRWPDFSLCTDLLVFKWLKSVSWTYKKSLYVSEGNSGSLLLQKGHLKVTCKRKSTCEQLVSAWFSVWTSQGLNLGPPDYESVALTDWATSPWKRMPLGFNTLWHWWVVLPWFEQGQTEPKPVVLPLHHRTILKALSSNGKDRPFRLRCKISTNNLDEQILFTFF